MGQRIGAVIKLVDIKAPGVSIGKVAGGNPGSSGRVALLTSEVGGAAPSRPAPAGERFSRGSFCPAPPVDQAVALLRRNQRCRPRPVLPGVAWRPAPSGASFPALGFINHRQRNPIHRPAGVLIFQVVLKNRLQGSHPVGATEQGEYD